MTVHHQFQFGAHAVWLGEGGRERVVLAGLARVECQAAVGGQAHNLGGREQHEDWREQQQQQPVLVAVGPHVAEDNTDN